MVDDSVNPTSPFQRLANANGVDVSGNHLYVASGAFAGPDGSLTIIDVSNPASPVKLSEVSDDSIDPNSPFTKLRGAWDVKVVDQTAFVTSISDDAVTVVDVSNPRLPRLIKEFVQGQGGLTTFQFTQGLDASGNTLYVTASTSGALNVFDLTSTLGLKVDHAVGIGTATPRSALDVAGMIRGTELAVDGPVSAQQIAAADSVTAVSNVMAANLLAGQRAGVGTNSPLAPLHVVSQGRVNTFLDGFSATGTWLVLGNKAGGTNWNLISTGSANGEGAGKFLIYPGGALSTISSFGNFVLEPNGMLGLGTFTPGTRLDVAGPSGNSVRIRGPGGAGATVALDLATYDPAAFGTNTPSARIQATDGNFSADVDLLTKIPGAATNPLVSRLHINSTTGRVGIGTRTPGRMLQVGDRFRPDSEGMIRLASRGGVGVAARQWDIGVPETEADVSGTGYSFVIDDVDLPNGVPEFIIRWDTRYVGIGTATPQAPLDVVGNNNFPHLRVSASSNAPFGSFLGLNATATAGGKEYFIFSTGATASEGQGKLVFQNHTDGRNIMALDGNGAVGIGTTAPLDSLLDVEGHTHINDNDIFLRGSTDRNHGLGFRANFAGQSIDGPVLYGFSGGALGTTSAGANWSLRWNTTGQVFTRGAINPPSDRNLKENFAPVDGRDVLERLAALPIARWNYKADTNATHLGPVAQDFHAAFGVGPDDRHIATVDADGVALAAIQGLNQKLAEREALLRRELERRDAENAELKEENQSLEKRLAVLEKIVLNQKSK